MGSRSYRQYCGLARALDLIGERWTLLIVRELLMGARRYTDLRESLPGIATNLLTRRLKDLESAGIVVRRELPPPAPATVYELTGHGVGLERAIIELGRWGGRSLGAPRPGEAFRASSFALAMRATYRPARGPAEPRSYQFRVDPEEPFRLRCDRSGVELDGDRSAPADFELECGEASVFLELLAGQVAPADALRSEAVRVSGEAAELDGVIEMFRFPADAESG